MLIIVANRAANAKGVICDLPIKNDFEAGGIATVHFKIASRLFQIYQAVQDELVRPGINRERTAQRLDKGGVDLISDAPPFGRLWYGEPNAVSDAIDYAKFRNRSHDAAGQHLIPDRIQ